MYIVFFLEKRRNDTKKKPTPPLTGWQACIFFFCAPREAD